MAQRQPEEEEEEEGGREGYSEDDRGLNVFVIFS